jgi:hypothetical protein
VDVMDIFEFFEEYDVQYFTSGKNVSKGFVNIQCPFCDDSSNHLGIRLNDFYIACWRCGIHSLFDLIKNVADCTPREAIKIEKSLSPGEDSRPPLNEILPHQFDLKKTVLPQESTKPFPKLHIDYLEKRGFTPPSHFIQKYKLQAGYTIGKYKFRIIIPVFMNRKLVSFTSRDITGIQSPKYLSASLKEGGNIKETIYNYDTITQDSDVILVEGPLDAWKLGSETCSFFGVTYTAKQIIALKNKNIRNLFILFDNNPAGRRGAKEIANVLSPLVKKTEIITLTNVEDPGELSLEDAQILKYQLGFKK